MLYAKILRSQRLSENFGFIDEPVWMTDSHHRKSSIVTKIYCCRPGALKRIRISSGCYLRRRNKTLAISSPPPDGLCNQCADEAERRHGAGANIVQPSANVMNNGGEVQL